MSRLILYVGICCGVSLASIGCSGTSEPKVPVAPKLSAAQLLLQQAEAHAQKGKQAQDAKQYTAAITHFTSALKTVQTLKTTHPKAPATLAFETSPTLAGQKLQDIETIHLPTMRFQQMRSTDMLGWILAEVHALRDETKRHRYYSRLFDQLLTDRDFDNAIRVMNQAKQDEGDDFVKTWPASLEEKKKAKPTSTSRFGVNLALSIDAFKKNPEYIKITKTERNNATFKLAALLKENTTKGVLENIRSYKNAFIRLHLLEQTILYVQRNQDHAILKDPSTRFELVNELFEHSVSLLSNINASLKMNKLVDKPAKKLGFKNKIEIYKALLEHHKKKPITEQRLIIVSKLIRQLDWKEDKTLAMKEQEALAARLIDYQAKNKLEKFNARLFVTNQLLHAKHVTPQRIKQAYTLAAKSDEYTRKEIHLKAQLQQITLGQPLTIKPDLTIPVAPVMKPDAGKKDTALFEQRQKTISALSTLPAFIKAYKTQNNSKAIKAIISTIKKSKKVHEGQRKKGEKNTRLDNLIYLHEIALLNALIYQNDNARAISTIQAIMKNAAYKPFLKKGPEALDKHTVKQKLTSSQRKQLSLIFLKLLQDTQSKYFFYLPYRNWFATMVAESNTKILKQALDQYSKSPAKIRVLNTYAEMYTKQAPKQRTKAVPQLIIDELFKIKLERLSIASFDHTIDMCAMPQASCTNQLIKALTNMNMGESSRELFVGIHIRSGHTAFVYDFIKQQKTPIRIGLINEALGEELKQHHDPSKILPPLRANIKTLQTQISTRAQRNYHSNIYDIFALSGHCEVLDAFIKENPKSGLSIKGAQGMCALRDSNYEANFPQLLAKWIAQQDDRIDDLFYLMKQRGVLNTPMLAKELKRLADANTPALSPRLAAPKSAPTTAAPAAK